MRGQLRAEPRRRSQGTHVTPTCTHECNVLECFRFRHFGLTASHSELYAGARIWAPWQLVCDDYAAIADEAIIYNPAKIHLGSHAIVSQQAYLCGATHDYEDPAFPLISFPITLGAYSRVCARATVQPGVTLGEGAILGLGAVATRDLEPWTIYGGIPAKAIKKRNQRQAAAR